MLKHLGYKLLQQNINDPKNLSIKDTHTTVKKIKPNQDFEAICKVGYVALIKNVH